jgi:hypothetical protein
MTFASLRRASALAATVAFLAVPAAFAQQTPASSQILVIQREYTKPGKSGAAHLKTESAFKAAAIAGKAPIHYLGMTSLSGPDRALFLSWYPSFESWETEAKIMDKLPAGATLDKIFQAESDVLSTTDQSVWMLDTDKSYNTRKAAESHLMEIESFKIKPGHSAQWDEAVKMVKEAYMKGLPDSHWAMYRQLYGTGGDTYIVIVGFKSGGEIDKGLMDGAKFVAAMGEAGMKKLDVLTSECVEDQMTNLFRFSPRMSLLPDDWTASDPDFWKPKLPPAPAAKKPAEK